jgi:DNA-binding response OmpR family regulator
MATRILIIEDDEAILAFLRRGLGFEGYEIDTAETGQKGLALAAGNRPDLVILDWMLPGMDGWKFVSGCAAWAKCPSSCSPPRTR